jgi:hypothetical protein
MDANSSLQKSCFFGAKGYESIYESLPMAVLTVYYICSSDPRLQKESSLMIMLLLLALSWLSICYGVTAIVLHDNDMEGFSNAFRIFSFFIVNVSWLLACCWGIFATENYIVLYCVLGVSVYLYH